MRKQITQIGCIGATLVGLTYCAAPANSATLQTSTQIASVIGNNNRVTQVNKQTSLDVFLFDLDLNTGKDESVIKNFINAEIIEFIADFRDNSLEIDQSIAQFAQLFRKKNRITQISHQSIFDVFFLDPELDTKENKKTSLNNILPSFDLSEILSDRISEKLPDINQSVTQEANVLGNNNRVKQVNNQTIIDFFLIDIKFSTQLDELVIRKAEDNWDNSLDFELNDFLANLATEIPFKELPDSFFQNNDPTIIENTNSSVNEVRSVAVPEPSYVFSLFTFAILCMGKRLIS
jgi:hypothetical protein